MELRSVMNGVLFLYSDIKFNLQKIDFSSYVIRSCSLNP